MSEELYTIHTTSTNGQTIIEVAETTEATLEEWTEHNAIIVTGITDVEKILDNQIGPSLKWMRDTRAYVHNGFESFEAYYTSLGKISKRRVYQLIDAEIIKTNISESTEFRELQVVHPGARPNLGPPLPNEKQSRVLKQIPSEQQGKVWTDLVKEAGNKLPTTAQTKEKVSKTTTKKSKTPTVQKENKIMNPTEIYPDPKIVLIESLKKLPLKDFGEVLLSVASHYSLSSRNDRIEIARKFATAFGVMK